MPNAPTTAVQFGTAAPTSTTIQNMAGDVVRNAEPATGSPSAWVCTAAGAPGTWKGLEAPPDATLYNQTITVTAAELAVLRATPKTLVAAPGAGKMVQFVTATLLLDYTAPAFTETAANFVLRYTGASGVIVSQVVENTGFIDQTADITTTAQSKIDAIATKAQAENQLLCLHQNGAGEFGGSGGSTLRVNVTYRVVSTGF